MGQNKTVRLYLLEEVKNKPYFLRVTVFSKVNSEDEGRALQKSFCSLRTMLTQMDRKEETIGNMSMLTQVRSNNERAMSITGWNGKHLDELNDLKEISEEDSFADDIESVKGDIQRSEGSRESLGPIVAKNMEQEETKEIKQAPKEEPK